MNVFIIIALAGIIALICLWPRKSPMKGTPARTWPAARRGKR